MKIPGIIVVSSSNTKPKSLIKLITKSQEIKEASENPGLIKHPWYIETKYYTAEVNFLGLENDFPRSDDFNNQIEALIIHMDTNKDAGLEDLSKWDIFDKDCSLEVKILVSNYCNSTTKITKSKALEWCLEHGFEFIELYPLPSNSYEDEDNMSEDESFEEKGGVERIIEALQSHTWPNLVMKEKDKTKKSSEKKLQGEDPFPVEDLDEFAKLFAQIHTIKDSLGGMATSERKQYAEQMVTAFWKAIGGDEEELFDV
ncbi:unnamed protein product [Phaedon cochleariae]|uniref:Alpha-and gamma-adaptin-binding protein p34 n=1 Tax=Phaedon cochleariae TaxID=80249 RepID=A0A9N9SIF5_PHACE|nr:unnamed protein product [Phaedon cochleariae]